MKKMILMLCMVATITSVADATTPSPLDLDGNGLVETADAKVIYGYILGSGDENVTLTMVDLDGNGKVNTADVVTLYNSIVKVTGVLLGQNELALKEGETTTLVATTVPANATNQVFTWQSDNTSVATVSDSGVVTAVVAGTATITVTSTEGGFTATCKVTVEEDSVTYDAQDGGGYGRS